MKIFVVFSAVVLLVIGVVAVTRRPRPFAPLAKVVRKASQSERQGFHVPPRDPGPPADSEIASRAYADSTLKVTYKSFRAAVATKNDSLRDALRVSLAKNLPTVIGWAQEDLAQATQSIDVEIARKTLESLRN